jgi:hypothetical protein
MITILKNQYQQIKLEYKVPAYKIPSDIKHQQLKPLLL